VRPGHRDPVRATVEHLVVEAAGVIPAPEHAVEPARSPASSTPYPAAQRSAQVTVQRQNVAGRAGARGHTRNRDEVRSRCATPGTATSERRGCSARPRPRTRTRPRWQTPPVLRTGESRLFRALCLRVTLARASGAAWESNPHRRVAPAGRF
jgi:hypothetical protein